MKFAILILISIKLFLLNIYKKEIEFWFTGDLLSLLSKCLRRGVTYLEPRARRARSLIRAIPNQLKVEKSHFDIKSLYFWSILVKSKFRQVSGDVVHHIVASTLSYFLRKAYFLAQSAPYLKSVLITGSSAGFTMFICFIYVV